MTKATIPGTNTTCGQTGVACYGYDRNGNRTTKQVNATTTTYTYHPTDEIKDQTISGTTKTFTYNLYGSQTTAFDAANAMTTSAYDTAERLLTVTPPTGGAATYAYDALGRINTRTIGTSVDTYSYLGSTETAWQIANAGGTGFTTKSALDATGARTAVTGNALTGYLGFDLHGNTALAENGSKTITDALRYDAWGDLIASTTSALPTPWRYQGRLDVGPDASNPLYDFGARDYRPVTGAFTSLDSYAGQAIDPLSMNRFLYAEANPSSFVDPDGHAINCAGKPCQYGENVGAPAGTRTKADVAAAVKAKQAAADDAIEMAYIAKKAGGAAAPLSVNPWALKNDPEWQSLWNGAQNNCTHGRGINTTSGCTLLSDLKSLESANRDVYCSAHADECKRLSDDEFTQTWLPVVLGVEIVGELGLLLDPAVGDEGIGIAAIENSLGAGQRVAGALQRGGLASVTKGNLGVALTRTHFERQGWTYLGKEISLEVNGVRWRADLLFKDAQGTLVAVESKFGPSAGYTRNQSITIPAMQSGVTGAFVGGNADRLDLLGATITRVEVKTWP